MASLKIRWKILVSVIFFIGCFVGLIFHMREVCDVYFKYQTRTSIRLQVPNSIPVPSLSVCVSYTDIIDRSNHKKYGLEKKPSMEDFQVYRESSLLTIKDILDLTPPGNETIQKCWFPSSDMLEMKEFKGHECSQSIKVTKYYTQQYICYMYSFTSLKTVDFLDVAHSLYYPMVTAGFCLQNLTSSMIPTLMTVFVDPQDRLPLYSRNFAKNFGTNKDRGADYVRVHFRLNEILQLPPPYDTGCTNVQEQEAHECKRMCLIKGMKVIDRFPSSEMTTQPVMLKHVNGEDMKNETIRLFVNQVNSKCKSKCTRPGCVTTYATTTLTLRRLDDTSGKLMFNIMIPDAASIVISVHEKMNLLDFIVYTCTCVGIWFGTSVFSLNPVAFGNTRTSSKQNKWQDKRCIESTGIRFLQRNNDTSRMRRVKHETSYYSHE